MIFPQCGEACCRELPLKMHAPLIGRNKRRPHAGWDLNSTLRYLLEESTSWKGERGWRWISIYDAVAHVKSCERFYGFFKIKFTD